MKIYLFVLLMLVSLPAIAHAEITRIWLTYRTHNPSKMVINWESSEPENSIVRFGAYEKPLQAINVEENVTLHHVEIPLSEKNTTYRHSVQTGSDQSVEATFKANPTGILKVAVVADWQGRPRLDSILKDDVHLLLTAGDNIGSLHQKCGPGAMDCTKPYGDLIDAHPELFRSIPFMPALGIDLSRPRFAQKSAHVLSTNVVLSAIVFVAGHVRRQRFGHKKARTETFENCAGFGYRP